MKPQGWAPLQQDMGRLSTIASPSSLGLLAAGGRGESVAPLAMSTQRIFYDSECKQASLRRTSFSGVGLDELELVKELQTRSYTWTCMNCSQTWCAVRLCLLPCSSAAVSSLRRSCDDDCAFSFKVGRSDCFGADCRCRFAASQL